VHAVCYGQSEIPTTLEAAAAAAAIAPQIHRPPALVTCSPWVRTRDVAAILAATFRVPLVVDRRLSELSFGEWEGRTYEAIERDDPARYTHWMKTWRTSAPPGGETVAELGHRVTEWLAERHDDDTLAVTHAGVIRTLRSLARGVDYAEIAGEPVLPLRVEDVGAPRVDRAVACADAP
jgi:broad specificity phosphatase PhoE